MSASEWRGLIVDVDGVLCDTLSRYATLASDYLRAHRRMPGPDLAQIIGDKTLPEGAAYIKHNYSVDDGVTEILNEWGWMLMDYYRQGAKAQPGAEALIKALRAADRPLAVIARVPEKMVKELLFRCNLDVGPIVSAYDLNLGKDEAALYIAAAKAIGLTPAETLVLDHQLIGLQSANRAGAATIAVDNGYRDDAYWATLAAEANQGAFRTLEEAHAHLLPGSLNA